MDSIVKAAIEKYGSGIAKTTVHVSSVKINLASGEGTISGLTVANPSGFSSARIFSLGQISAKIEPRTVTSKVVVIDKLIIAAPYVVYERNSSGETNIKALQKNIQQSTQRAAKKASEEKNAGGKEVKLLIKKLVIENGRIDIRIAALVDKPGTIKLPRIERTGIGKGGGATPSQVADEVMSALLEEVGLAVAQAGIDGYFGKGIGGAIKKLFGK